MTSLKGADPYAVAEERLATLFAREHDPGALRAGICRILNEAVPTYNWVGVYVREGANLVLAAWNGPAPTVRARLSLGDDSAGAAVRRRATIVVDDTAAPGSHATLPGTRAEIAIPIGDEHAAHGALVIASDHRAAFGPADRALLEDVAARLATRWAVGRGA